MKKIIIKNDKKYTYNDYMKFDESERWEIIDGIAYMVSSGSSKEHQTISGNLVVKISNYLKNKKDKECEVFFRPLAVFLPKDNETVKTSSSIVEPDIIAVCDKNKLRKNGCAGAPDLIIEIMSTFSGIHDKVRKYKLYEENKVKEYIVVYPSHLIIEKFSYDEDKQKYNSAECFGIDDIMSLNTFPELQINLEEVFSEIIEAVLEDEPDED